MGNLMAIIGVLRVMDWDTAGEPHLGLEEIGDGLMLKAILLRAGFTVCGERQLGERRGGKPLFGSAPTLLGHLCHREGMRTFAPRCLQR